MTIMAGDGIASSGTDEAQIVLFALNGQRYALRLEVVEQVIRAVAVTPVPESPAFVLGLVNMAGQLLPVFSLRRCLGLPDCPIRPEDQFVIVRTSRLTLAVVVDETLGLSVVNAAQTVAMNDAMPAGARRVQNLAKINGDIILIYDLEKLFTPEERDRVLQAKAAMEI